MLIVSHTLAVIHGCHPSRRRSRMHVSQINQRVNYRYRNVQSVRILVVKFQSPSATSQITSFDTEDSIQRFLRRAVPAIRPAVTALWYAHGERQIVCGDFNCSDKESTLFDDRLQEVLPSYNQLQLVTKST